MISIYSPGNEGFEKNGNCTLFPTSCLAHFEINGEWTVTMVHPLDERSDFIEKDAILKVPTPYGDLLYQIKKYDKSDYDVQVTAYPIFLRAKGLAPFLWDKRAVNCTGQDALDIILGDSVYQGESNITKTSTAYFEQMNVIQAINGDTDNSFINRWGGEIAWLNNKVLINDRLGQENQFRAEFGYNLSGVTESYDDSEVITRIYPKAYNGYMLPDHESIDSPLINNYTEPRPQIVEYSNIKLASDASENDAENGVIVCDTLDDLYDELRSAASKDFENGCDLPKITYQVSLVDLSRLDIYKEFKDLVTINLGDSGKVRHRKMKIETTQRVISMDYDCILEKIDSMTLGSDTASFFEKVGSVTSSYEKVVDMKSNTVIAEKVQGIINAAKASLKAQKDVAHKQEIRAMLFEDLDPNSPTSDWVWGTAIDFESIIADYIITGILSDKNGNFYLNMDTGELVMNDGTFKGVLNTYKDVGIGNWLYLGTQATDGNFSASGMTVGPLGSGTENKPLINMWGNQNNRSGSINILPFSGADDCSIFLTRDNNGNSIQLKTSALTINGKGGLTGTYRVENSLTVEKGLVTGVS
jgi:phage minor structural protein